ncbi:restriction endonuclease [Streptomyces sp. NPDC048253]|uniref:restriction endonuclease n=1 Tax=Streptomyces sp. NPDC048253 TaxID=3365524 RepID=UPI0037237876
MPSPSDQNSESDPPDDAEGDPLSNMGRFTAGAIGLLLCGSGTTAVFITENQAGSVALILGGIIFLLMLVSGNPLLSFGHGDTQMRFATKRRRELAIEEVREAPPQEARRALEILETVDPGARGDAAFIQTSAHVYERLIAAEIAHLFPTYQVVDHSRDFGADFKVSTPGGQSIGVEVKYLIRKTAVSSAEIQKLIGAASVGTEGYLLVSNRRPTAAAAELMYRANERGIKVHLLHWRDDQDNVALKRAINTLLDPDS